MMAYGFNYDKKTDKDRNHSFRVIKLFWENTFLAKNHSFRVIKLFWKNNFTYVQSIITKVDSTMKVAQQGMFTLSQMNLGAIGAE